MFKSVELFAGAGGLALGLEQAGFDSQLVVEFDKQAVNTLKSNRPNWNIVEDDINIVVSKGIVSYLKQPTKIDFLSGGYPCQAFSYAGKKLGLNDTRGTLFYSYAMALEQLNPKVFLVENVRGLVSHQNGDTLKTMIDVFTDIGYSVQYKILNALNYGVAQKRERIIIVGIRNDLEKLVNYSFPEPSFNQLTLRDVLQNVPTSPYIAYSANKKKVLDLVKAGGCWRDLPNEVAKDYMGKSYFSGGGRTGMARRLSWNEPSLTVLCSPSQKQTDRCHPDETRPFTIRENARIQGFPDEWTFSGSISNQYKQIGNAVPVPFAKAIGLSIYTLLKEIEEKCVHTA